MTCKLWLKASLLAVLIANVSTAARLPAYTGTVIPRPRKILSLGQKAVPKKPEAYAVRFRKTDNGNQVFVIGRDNRGLFYGAMTILQLLGHDGDKACRRQRHSTTAEMVRFQRNQENPRLHLQDLERWRCLGQRSRFAFGDVQGARFHEILSCHYIAMNANRNQSPEARTSHHAVSLAVLMRPPLRSQRYARFEVIHLNNRHASFRWGGDRWTPTTKVPSTSMNAAS